jgi:hypothetical protein
MPEIPIELLSENLRGIDQMGDVDVDVMMILKDDMITMIVSLWAYLI